jgi:hypothetical protein
MAERRASTRQRFTRDFYEPLAVKGNPVTKKDPKSVAQAVSELVSSGDSNGVEVVAKAISRSSSKPSPAPHISRAGDKGGAVTAEIVTAPVNTAITPAKTAKPVFAPAKTAESVIAPAMPAKSVIANTVIAPKPKGQGRVPKRKRAEVAVIEREPEERAIEREPEKVIEVAMVAEDVEIEDEKEEEEEEEEHDARPILAVAPTVPSHNFWSRLAAPIIQYGGPCDACTSGMCSVIAVHHRTFKLLISPY